MQQEVDRGAGKGRRRKNVQRDREREGEAETETETEKETQRLKTGRQSHREGEIVTQRGRDKSHRAGDGQKRCRQTQAGRQTDRHGQADRQREDRQTETEKEARSVVPPLRLLPVVTCSVCEPLPVVQQ